MKLTNTRRELLALLLLLGTAGCRKELPTAPVVPVKVKVLVSEEIRVSTRFSGSIQPLQSTTLSFKLPGTVRSLCRPQGLHRDVQVGDTLAKGTVIAEFDEGDLRRAKAAAEAKVAQLEARVATTKDNLAIAIRTFERYSKAGEGAVSKEARDEVEARRITAAGELTTAGHALAEARVRLDQANDDYSNRQLVVPFDRAIVAEKNIEPGERKAAHELAFRLIDLSTVYVNFGVPDTMIGDPAIEAAGAQRVVLGQTLPVDADAFGGRTLAGTITKIAPEADPKTRTFLTQLTLANPEVAPGQPLLRPGMIVSVRVGGALDRKAMLLPLTAVHPGGSRDELTVYELVEEHGCEVVRARKVTLGGVHDNQVELVPAGSGVRPGSRIIVTTAERVADGMVVRVMRDRTDAAGTLAEAK